jgi:predicted nucleic acid-binding protein
MKYLLDVNVLLAAIWTQHPHHTVTFAWLAGKEVVVCPLVELGFVESAPQKGVRFPMDKPANSRKVHHRTRRRSHCRRFARVDSKPDRSEDVTFLSGRQSMG